MDNSRTPELGTRNEEDVRMRDEFLRTGKIPLGLLLKKGMISILTDPWLTFIKYLTGPVGFKARQWYWRHKLGQMGTGVVIDPDVEFYSPKNIYIDDFAYIGKGAKLVANEGYIKVGKRCHLVSWIIGYAGVEIGNYVAIGNSAILSASDSHQGGYRMAGSMIPMEQRHIRHGKIVIEDDAFVGHFCIVLPGVRIGEGAVVAPHSLVVNDIEPWTVVKGSPAVPFSKRKKVKFPPPDKI
jgi:acetyltransferase-like isoleucine patch superfamily enzyme